MIDDGSKQRFRQRGHLAILKKDLSSWEVLYAIDSIEGNISKGHNGLSSGQENVLSLAKENCAWHNQIYLPTLPALQTEAGWKEKQKKKRQRERELEIRALVFSTFYQLSKYCFFPFYPATLCYQEKVLDLILSTVGSLWSSSTLPIYALASLPLPKERFAPPGPAIHLTEPFHRFYHLIDVH